MMQNNSSKIYAISPIVWLEAVEGVIDKKSQSAMKKLLDLFVVADYQQYDMLWAMQMLEKYKLSHNIGMMDCLIAAPAYRQNLPLLTRNLKHFTPLLNNLAQKPY